jgi:hypothetical protein
MKLVGAQADLRVSSLILSVAHFPLAREETGGGTLEVPGSPLYAHRIVRAVMMITSRPSRSKASHIRSCVENGTVLTKRVMYHLVAHAEVEIMLSRFQRSASHFVHRRNAQISASRMTCWQHPYF